MNHPPKVNLPGKSLLAGMVGMFLPSFAVAEINSTFVSPPYEIHGTIIGQEGWEMQNREPHPVFTDPMQAVVVDSPVANASQPTTLSLETLVRNPETGDLGDRFVVETQFAVAFNPRYEFDGGLYYRFGTSHERSPFHFGFYYGVGGGLYCQGRGDRVILVPRGELLENTAYKFVVTVDMGAQTLRVKVTCPDNPTFLFESEDISFQEEFLATGSNKLGVFSMGNNKPTTLDAYVDYVKVKASFE